MQENQFLDTRSRQVGEALVNWLSRNQLGEGPTVQQSFALKTEKHYRNKAFFPFTYYLDYGPSVAKV